jgi:hypothetical protein
MCLSWQVVSHDTEQKSKMLGLPEADSDPFGPVVVVVGSPVCCKSVQPRPRLRRSQDWRTEALTVEIEGSEGGSQLEVEVGEGCSQLEAEVGEGGSQPEAEVGEGGSQP